MLIPQASTNPASMKFFSTPMAQNLARPDSWVINATSERPVRKVKVTWVWKGQQPLGSPVYFSGGGRCGSHMGRGSALSSGSAVAILRASWEVCKARVVEHVGGWGLELLRDDLQVSLLLPQHSSLHLQSCSVLIRWIHRGQTALLQSRKWDPHADRLECRRMVY